MEKTLNIILGILAFSATILSYYIAIREKIKSCAQDAINNVEDLQKIGEEKMQIAVEQIYNMLPIIARPVFTKPFIEQIIQIAFDKMQEFAKKQVNKGGESNGS